MPSQYVEMTYNTNTYLCILKSNTVYRGLIFSGEPLEEERSGCSCRRISSAVEFLQVQCVCNSVPPGWDGRCDSWRGRDGARNQHQSKSEQTDGARNQHQSKSGWTWGTKLRFE